MTTWRLLVRDRVAGASAAVLILVGLTAAIGPHFLASAASAQDLYAVNQPPFRVEHGWQYILGSDALGRSVLARLVVATQTTALIVLPAVLVSLIIGALWGLLAGYRGGWRETVALRGADVIQSFPALLLALVVLYVLSPSKMNIVLVMAIVGIPIYLRTSRAEASELRSKLFVQAATTFGSPHRAVVRRHVAPNVGPTLVTVAVTEISTVMLGTASLSFLGLGVQPPEVDLGLMVAQGRQYLQTAWWVSVFPGLMIVLISVSATMLAAWLRLALDPSERWRLLTPKRTVRPRSLFASRRLGVSTPNVEAQS